MIIPLSQDQYATLDPDDCARLSAFRWSFRADRGGGSGCAARHVRSDGKDRLSYLHREVMAAPPGKVVIFLNHDKLDCRRSNLKVVSRRRAAHYRRVRRDSISGLKGIRFVRATCAWTASIQRDGLRYHLGSFTTKGQALLAYEQAEKRLGGDSVRLTIDERIRINTYG
jgi:hypothetical protein